MRTRFLGKSTRNNGSPTLYATERGTYIVQGWRVPGKDQHVEIPYELLTFLERGTCFNVKLDDTGKGTFLLTGTPVVDAEVLNKFDVPDHELCIEVPMGVEVRPDEPSAVLGS
ncbi:hypothetical protein [Nocardia sp. NPDC058666]